MTELKINAKRAPLSSDMKIRLSRILQLRALEEIGAFVQRDKTTNKIVFHGGTSLSIVHGSPRWSEDLDFMGTPEAVDGILNRHQHIEAALRLRMSLEFPGSDISLKVKSPGSRDRYGNVDRFQIRWEHPDFIGVVKVKSEFYICPPIPLANYRASVCHPVSDGVVSRTGVTAADPVSIWADKIVAIAQRPALKHRDIHDLGYLHANFDIGSKEDRIKALDSTIGIYGRSASEISEGLARELVTDGIDDYDGFRENMAQWFTERVMLDMEKTGHLSTMFDGFLDEFSMGRTLVAQMSDAENTFESMSCTM